MSTKWCQGLCVLTAYGTAAVISDALLPKQQEPDLASQELPLPTVDPVEQVKKKPHKAKSQSGDNFFQSPFG